MHVDETGADDESFGIDNTPSLDPAAMDRSADPCVDFYQYTCGGWMQRNPIPPDQARWSVYGKVADENRQFLWGILEQAAKGGAERSAVQQKIGDFFGACMDEDRVEKLGMSPLQTDLSRVDALTNVDGLSDLLPSLHLASSTGRLMPRSAATWAASAPSTTSW